MRVVRAPLATEVHRGVAAIIGRLSLPLFRLKALYARPSFQQRAIDGEVLVRRQALLPRLFHHLPQKQLRHLRFQQPVAPDPPLGPRQIRAFQKAVSIVSARKRKVPTTRRTLSKEKLRVLLGPDPIALLLRLRDELRLLNAPLDLNSLEASGLVVRDADNWFRVPNIWKLPKDVAHRVSEIESDCIGTKIRFGDLRLKAAYEEMEEFALEYGLDDLPSPPESEISPVEPENDDEGPRRMEEGDRIAVKGSNGRGWFRVTVTGIDRCRGCGAMIVWGRTEKGKRIPLNPWPVGADETKSHFKACFRRRRPWGLAYELSRAGGG
jgi:hypothetical protein